MGRFLLDTHTLLWFLANDSKLSVKVDGLISNSENDCLVSTASLWEIAIKHNLGKLTLKFKYEDFPHILRMNNIEILPISFEHINELSNLELIHRDPFDRLIISQAKTENFIILSKDKQFKKYEGLNVHW